MSGAASPKTERQALMAIAPPSHAVAITPSDVADLSVVSTKAIHVGVGGDVKVDLPTGTVTYKNIPSGTTKAIMANRVYATDTTATNLIAEYV